MENSHESHVNGNRNGNSHNNGNRTLSDPNLQIIRHPSYHLAGRFSLHWFDIRVFYVRISNYIVDDSTPECLMLNHIPINPDTVLEVNGARCSIDSEGISSVLRKGRVDKKSEEATFFSTDSIRFTGGIKFEIRNKEDVVITGVFDMCDTNGFIGESNNVARRWVMNCEPVISAGTGLFKGNQMAGSEIASPTIEVYVAGCFSGSPIILTKSLQFNHPRKHKKGVLDSIPEYDASESREDVASGLGLQVTDYRNYKPESAEDYDNMYWRQQTEYIEGEDGELSWFNAGVRVGVGIGLGICLGVGVGVGLLVRTYQTTTGTFKRRLF